MDHLPFPDYLRDQEWKVHYLGIVCYDGGVFEEFPERVGLEKTAIVAGDTGGYNFEFVESVLQEWLFFGILHEFTKACGSVIDRQDLIRDEDGVQLITTRPLLKHIANTFPDPSILPIDRDTTQLKKSFGLATQFVQQLLKTAFVLSQKGPAPDEATMILPRSAIQGSIMTMHESLSRSADRIFGEYLPLPPSDKRQAEWWLNVLNRRGWCPHRVEMAVLSGNLMSVYAAGLPSYDLRDHSRCSTSKCSPLAGDDCKPLHRGSCNIETCSSVTLPEQVVFSIMDGGGYPALRLTDDGQFQVVDGRNSDEVVAISHVWSHGLGNSYSNHLPSCQIQRLFQLVRGINNNCTLWIDTLCVPVAPPYRMRGISQLKDVYSSARHVLVIDRQLVQVGNDIVEQRMQLLCSEWMRRLWTMQEGLLAKSLLVQFAHEVRSLDDLLDWEQHPKPLSSTWFSIYVATISRLETLFLRETSENRLLQILENLQLRVVTKKEDEPICLSFLAGLDMKPYEQRAPTMQDFYRGLPEIPETLAFTHKPRLQSKGLHWAPSSFLHGSQNLYTTRPKLGKLTSRGLLVFAKESVEIETQLSPNHAVKKIRILLVLGAPQPMLYAEISYGNTFNAEMLQKSTIILEETFSSLAEGLIVSAILVTNVVSQDGIFICHHQSTILVASSNHAANQLDSEDDLSRIVEVTGRYHGPRTWCID